MKKIFHTVIVVFLLPFGEVGWGLAQNKIDSLKALLKKDKEDTNKVNHLVRLTRQCELTGKFDEGLNYGNTAFQLAEKLNWKKGIANAYGNIGNIYLGQADYPQALDYLLKALKMDEELHNKKGVATRLGNIGIVYADQGDYSKALDNFFKALKMDEELGNKKGIASNLGNIGIVYKDQAHAASLASGRSDSLRKKALDYYFKAVRINEETGNKNWQANNLGNIGNVYKEQADYPKALDYYFRALEMNGELGNKNGIAIMLGNIGTLYSEQKKYQDSYDYLYRALALSNSIGAMNDVKDHYEILSTLYEKSNISLPDSTGGRFLNMEQMRLRALYYHKLYIAVRDTLFSEENKKQLVRKEMNFEFEKKEAAAKAEQEKQSAVAAAESRRQRIVLALVSCFLLLVLVLAGFIFRSLRITRKQKNLIEEQKQLVEEKQKEILDSIYYARRIQRSLLPTEKYIEKNLNRLRKS